jgi:hypothetical protein
MAEEAKPAAVAQNLLTATVPAALRQRESRNG